VSAKRWTASDLPDMSGRTVVVTGANSGIGAVTARELARAGAHVVLAVRDPARGDAAARSMPGSTEVRRLDLADLASVRAFAAAWDGPLDVLINNAGVMAVAHGRTADGFELQLGTNHLGPFALTNLLLEHVGDRVVTVASAATSTTCRGSTATTAGAPTASPSSPTCCSRSSCSAASTRPARRSARTRRTRAGRRRACRATPPAAWSASRWRSATA
jgi:NAD(P)-dependent dehydrogenase (short-subunit alcohol dehydrogenase family)